MRWLKANLWLSQGTPRPSRLAVVRWHTQRNCDASSRKRDRTTMSRVALRHGTRKTMSAPNSSYDRGSTPIGVTSLMALISPSAASARSFWRKSESMKQPACWTQQSP